MVKKALSLFLVVCFLFSISSPVFASHISSSETENGIIIQNHTTEHLLSPPQIASYQIYELLPSPNSLLHSNTSISAKQFALSHCELISISSTGNFEIKKYESSSLRNYLYNIDKLVEIICIDNILYISYVTKTNEEVTLCYDDTSLVNKVIYNPASDTAVFCSDNFSAEYKNFRAGCSYEMSDELLEEIQQAGNDLSALSQIEQIQASKLPDGSIIITPTLQPETRAAYGFASDAEMLADLKSKHPYVSQRIISLDNVYSTLLQRSLPVKVTFSRDSYVKKHADWQTFGVSTTITIIAAFLGRPISSTVAILTALGILIAGGQTVLQEVTLCRSAIYQYKVYKQGYVYDSTTWNSYVLVAPYSITGEFTGGYDDGDVFTWTSNISLSVNEISTTTVLNNAVDWYETHVYYDGECSLYYPYP